MKGLILKDLYYMKIEGKRLIPMFIVLLIMFFNDKNFNIFTFVIVFYMGMLSIGNIFIEKKNDFNKFIISTPVNKKDIVFGKYIFLNCTVIITFLILLLLSKLVLKIDVNIILKERLIIFAVISILLNLYLFLSLKLENDKVATLFSIITMGGLVVPAIIFTNHPEEMPVFIKNIFLMNKEKTSVLSMIIYIFFVLLFSIWSYRDFKNKEF
ncbi:ABC-2 transporter permease [Miniphocaeibacter halophilus]|uniref:ABC-2 transporter permease n=1 Tax=Miniphocaeibacter halophilus TaxID=2931922 RepID=A0AC61NAV6_9FIRM|nr:ABC-2 transporter permease [Miniphocaeibacter halophilus]QQK08498.1 ABC-2 transporter permease [Miniphocaeibacter halophilus]